MTAANHVDDIDLPMSNEDTGYLHTTLGIAISFRNFQAVKFSLDKEADPEALGGVAMAQWGHELAVSS